MYVTQNPESDTFEPGDQFYLALGPEIILEKPLSNPLVLRSVNTIADPDELLEQIARIRQQVRVSAPEESYLGLNAVTAPISSFGNRISGLAPG